MPASTNRAPRATASPRPLPDQVVGPPTEPAGAPPLEPERRSRFHRDVSATQAKSTRPRPKTDAASTRWPWLDVTLGALVALAAGFTSATGADGPVRLGLGLAMLLFVPGYLLLQAFAVPVPSGKARMWQALAAIGISPAVVGVLALATSFVQGGFKLGVIVVLVTLACVAFAAAALVRRRSLAHAALRPADATPPSASPAGAPSATAKTGMVRP